MIDSYKSKTNSQIKHVDIKHLTIYYPMLKQSCHENPFSKPEQRKVALKTIAEAYLIGKPEGFNNFMTTI